MSRWFWALSNHQLKDHACFNGNDHSFHLLRPPIDQVPTGRYQLIRRGDHSETLANAHIYRLTHPLGEWVIKTAKNQNLPTAHIHFDYQAHGAKITVLERLLGQSGTLVLPRFSIEALDRIEDHLIFAAETSDGEILPAETAQKLLQLPSAQCVAQEIHTTAAIDRALITSQQQLTRMVNSRNLAFFEEEVDKPDHWADDIKSGLEVSIKELDRDIKEIRRNAKIAPTLEEKLSWQEKQRDLERTPNKQRKELFDRQDEVDQRRETLIEQLESKLNQKLEIEDLFLISWQLS